MIFKEFVMPIFTAIGLSTWGLKSIADHESRLVKIENTSVSIAQNAKEWEALIETIIRIDRRLHVIESKLEDLQKRNPALLPARSWIIRSCSGRCFLFDHNFRTPSKPCCSLAGSQIDLDVGFESFLFYYKNVIHINIYRLTLHSRLVNALHLNAFKRI